MHSGMVARFMFHEYIDHTYLPHPCGGFSVATKTFFLLSLHIAATSACHHHKATLSNIISNRPKSPLPQNPTLPSHTTSPHPLSTPHHPPHPLRPAPKPSDISLPFHLLEFTRMVAVCFEVRMLLLGSRRGERVKGEGGRRKERYC